MSNIRSAFHDELEGVSQSLVVLCERVANMMENATTSILTRDLNLAEEVITADVALDEFQHELDARIIDIVARQQPVASDLRALAAALRMGSDLERMGDLAEHVAKVTRLRHPNSVIPDELIRIFTAKGAAVVKIARKTAEVIATRDIDKARSIERDDDEIDNLHRELIAALIAPNWVHGVETAIDLTLVGRYYERYADHAVSVARRVFFLVTGKFA